MPSTNKDVSALLNKVSFWTITIGLVLYTILLIIICCISPQLDFIKKKPIAFLIELLAFPTFACFPLIFFAYYRELSFKDTLIFVLSFWVKVLILHLLLEISAFYNWITEGVAPTPPKAPKNPNA